MNSEYLVYDYILDRLEPAERRAFEEQLDADPNLAENVEMQRTALLDDYVEGLLDDARKTALEARLADDPLLREELELLQATTLVVRHGEEYRSFKADLQKMTATGGQTEQPAHGRFTEIIVQWRRPLLAAAGLALLLLAWHLIENHTKPVEENPIVAEYNPDLYRRIDLTNQSANNPLAEFEIRFNAKKYNMALPLIVQYNRKSDTPGDFYLLLEGLCRLRKENPDLPGARSIFEKLATSGDYKNEALWFLALSYADGEKWADCAAALQQIPEDWRSLYPKEHVADLEALALKNAAK